MKKICLIVAVSIGDYVIGHNNDLPKWDIRDDRIFFKKKTEGNAVILGRKNYQSLPDNYRPLPNRTNIIMTNSPIWLPDEVENDSVVVVNSLWQALEEAEKAPGEKIFIIGGGEIYKVALEKLVIDEIYITYVDGDFEGDVFFPVTSLPLVDCYKLVNDKSFEAIKDRNSHPFRIVSYERIRA